jgi:hypothetical protein
MGGVAATAAKSFSRLARAAGERPTINILNSNNVWSGVLTGSIASAYKAAAVTGESNPYESHFEKLAVELSQQSDRVWPARSPWRFATLSMSTEACRYPSFQRRPQPIRCGLFALLDLAKRMRKNHDGMTVVILSDPYRPH